jgi:urea transport system substrate-binding protein
MHSFSRRDFLKTTAAVGVGAAATGLGLPSIVRAQGGGTVKIGVLHSLSGTMAISEVSLRDVVLMAVEEINAKGGVMGKKIEPVVVDPASNWDLFAEKAKQLLLQDKVAVVFGCWTSVSRKSVLPVFENNNGLLFYPVQYEGEECSKNVFYTGATPNQQLIPAAEYLMSKEGGGYKKFYLLGTDYVFPRTANKILRAFLLAKGIPADSIAEEYTPFNHQDYQTIVGKIKRFSSGGNAAVLSTINGDSNVPFYKEFANQGLRSEQCPIMAFSVAEDELRGMDTSRPTRRRPTCPGATSASPTTRWRRRTSASTSGSRRPRRRSPSTSTPSARPCTARSSSPPAARSRWTRPTSTRTSRC